VPTSSRTHDLVVAHRGTRIDRADRALAGPIPVTSPLRTLIDLAGRLEDGRLAAAMESVFRQGIGTPERLAVRLAALRGSGRPGAGRLAALLDERGDGAVLDSVLEARVWRLLCRWGVPLPKRQHWVTLPGGRYRLDFAWPDQRLGLECDGWEHHGRRSAFDANRARLAEFAAARWRIVPVTWAACTRAGFIVVPRSLGERQVTMNRRTGQSMGTLRAMRPSMRAKISSRLWPVMVRPWLRWPTMARLGSGASRTSSATDSASSTVPHG
jgi:hypothetical protein